MTTPDKHEKPIGAGATAEIYPYGEGRVLKFSRPWVPVDWIHHEANATRMAYELGLPVPRIYEVIVDDKQRGIVMERIEGPMMISSMMLKPWKNSHYASILAELQVKINALEAPEMPPLRSRLEKNIRDETIIPEDMKEAALKILRELPDGEKLCHYDLHPLNVLMSPQGPVIIDWSGAAKGDPMADLARTWLLCTHPPIPPKPIRWASDIWIRNFFSKCFKEYSRLATVSRERYERWKIPIIAARIPEELSNDRKRYLLTVLEKRLKKVESL